MTDYLDKIFCEEEIIMADLDKVISSLQEIKAERELIEPVLLCDSKGNLNPASVGWSRYPLHICNLKGHFPRKKKWNYWCVTNPDALFSITLSNVDYLGLAFAYFYDFKTGRFIEKTVQTLVGKGIDLHENVDDEAVFDHPEMRVTFSGGNGLTKIFVSCPDFSGIALNAEFFINKPVDHETLSVVIPWDANHYQFTSKQNCLPANGSVKLGNETYGFQSQNSFACLDFGRGIWKYNSVWNWASTSGRQDNHLIGLNLGGRWTDGTGMTENGLFVDGHLSKISEDMAFIYDTSDFMKPWTIKTKLTDRVHLTFTPFYERVAKTDALILKSEVHQMFGRFAGYIVPDSGERIQIDNMIGWAEDHEARW